VAADRSLIQDLVVATKVAMAIAARARMIASRSPNVIRRFFTTLPV
jgi:hypothetical protein